MWHCHQDGVEGRKEMIPIALQTTQFLRVTAVITWGHLLTSVMLAISKTNTQNQKTPNVPKAAGESEHLCLTGRTVQYCSLIENNLMVPQRKKRIAPVNSILIIDPQNQKHSDQEIFDGNRSAITKIIAILCMIVKRWKWLQHLSMTKYNRILLHLAGGGRKFHSILTIWINHEDFMLSEPYQSYKDT